MKKKILFCVPPSCGGAERVTLTIAKLLDKEKFNIKVVIIGKTTGEIKEFIPDYMDIIHVKIHNIWDFTTLKLIKLFKKEKPNTVFCSLMYLNVRIILAAKIVGGIRAIVRNNIAFNKMRFDKAFLIKRLYPYADVIILQSEEMKQEIKDAIKIEKHKLHVIFNPIDTTYIEEKLKQCTSPFDIKYLNFVFVGRIDYVKGLDVLLPAFAKIVKHNTISRLYIVGKIFEADPYFQSLQKLVIELHLEEHIIWTDFTNNPYQYIKYANCFVLPSRVEGLPNVLLDAMYLQVPVVATRSVPVIDRIVTTGRGIVVDVDNSDALASAMMKMINLQINAPYIPNGNEKLISLFL